FDGFRSLAGCGQHHERFHGVVVRFRQIAASWEWRLARQRDVRVLRCPNRLETALLKRADKLRRRHRIIGKEHRAAECMPLSTAVCWSTGEVIWWCRRVLWITHPTTYGCTRTAASRGQALGERIHIGDRRTRGAILGQVGRLAQNHSYRHGCV